MLRSIVASFLVAAAALAPASVALADGDCPPGSWFCESVTVGPGVAPAPNAPPPQAAPPGPSSENFKRHHRRPPSETVEVQGQQGVQIQAQGPVVIYTQGGARPGPVVAAPPPPVYVEGPPQRRLVLRRLPAPAWREHFGINVRAEGAAFASASGGSSGMGGVGASLRWRPLPALAFDFGGDILGGNDYYSNGRVETALSLSGMVYFNPRSIVQVYAIAGMHLSHAEITSGQSFDTWSGFDTPSDTSRNYIGGQGGLGLEFRIARHFAINVDGLALIRKSFGNDSPEFVNTATGQTTNTSAAGMGRAGMTFWW